MTSHHDWFGVDVSKKTLDVFAPNFGTFQFPNSEDGREAFAAKLSCRAVAGVVMEATGGYAMSRILAVLIAMLACLSAAFADNYVQGYIRKDGTYVAPHYQTSPNSTKLDNWSTKGNDNPYTGKAGTVDPYKLDTPSYGNRYRYR